MPRQTKRPCCAISLAGRHSRLTPHLLLPSSLATDPDREARAEKVAQTGKYDKRAIRARMELESWLEDNLPSALKDGADPDELNIDLEEVRGCEGSIFSCLCLIRGTRFPTSLLVCPATHTHKVLDADADERETLVRNLIASQASDDAEQVSTFVSGLLSKLSAFESQFGEEWKRGRVWGPRQVLTRCRFLFSAQAPSRRRGKGHH